MRYDLFPKILIRKLHNLPRDYEHLNAVMRDLANHMHMNCECMQEIRRNTIPDFLNDCADSCPNIVARVIRTHPVYENRPQVFLKGRYPTGAGKNSTKVLVKAFKRHDVIEFLEKNGAPVELGTLEYLKKHVGVSCAFADTMLRNMLGFNSKYKGTCIEDIPNEDATKLLKWLMKNGNPSLKLKEHLFQVVGCMEDGRLLDILFDLIDATSENIDARQLILPYVIGYCNDNSRWKKLAEKFEIDFDDKGTGSSLLNDIQQGWTDRIITYDDAKYRGMEVIRLFNLTTEDVWTALF